METGGRKREGREREVLVNHADKRAGEAGEELRGRGGGEGIPS